MANRYTMNKTLLRSLWKLATHPNQPVKNIGMTKSEYSVYTKLKHWELIQRLEDGLWVLTPKGKQFLKNEIAVPKFITYFRDKLVETDGSTFALDIFDEEESKQKYRELMVAI